MQDAAQQELAGLTLTPCVRHEHGVEVPALTVDFEGVPLALFTRDNLEERAREYVRTHGYLARWSKSWMLGQPASWQ